MLKENKPESPNYLQRFPNLLDCKNSYRPWQFKHKVFPYSQPAPVELHEVRITRALMVQFPIEKMEHYVYELKWLYKSWTNMLKYEPLKWRTDLVIFIENDSSVFSRPDFFLNELNCRFNNLRKSPEDKPMCTLLNYMPLKKRNYWSTDWRKEFNTSEEKYNHLLEKVNVFETKPKEFEPFYKMLRRELDDYVYVDSILIAFDG